MSKSKLFTEKERDAIQTVIDMGLTVHNSKGNYLKSEFGDVVIVTEDWHEKEYKSISTALSVFMKQESDYHNGI